VLSGEDISPQQPGKRRAECCAECAVVDSERHTIHSGPECPVGNWDVIFDVNLFPRLDYAGEKDSGADIRSGKLIVRGIR